MNNAVDFGKCRRCLQAGCLGWRSIWPLFGAPARSCNQQAEAQIRQADAAAKQADLGRQKLIGDLFNQSVGQLRDEKLEVRLFAVYTLRKIGSDFPEYQTVVLELFASFVRENQNKWGESGPPVDVLEIMKALEVSLGSER